MKILTSTIPLLMPCLLGMIGMICKGVPVGIWIQNPAFIALLALASQAVAGCRIRFHARAVLLVSMLLLALTFLGQEIDGVHRWLRLPGFTVNIGAVVLPVSIVAFARLAREKQTALVFIGITGFALMLYLQPDASQLLAFSLPMVVLLIDSGLPNILRWGEGILLLLLTLLSWLHIDTLAPVSYTEGILTSLRGLSMILYLMGVISLLWVPWSMIAKKDGIWGKELALYYLLMILASFTGRFPVPFMGYGVSPILGFYLALLASGFCKEPTFKDQPM